MSESYSKLATFEQCPYKYKLIYLDNHYIKDATIATDFGTLIHHVEEQIGIALKDNKSPNYNSLINEFNEQVLKIKNKYPDDFYSLDKSRRTYADKVNYYINVGIYRLEKRIKEQKLEVIALEKEFYLEFGKYTFHGFIDRILKKGDQYIIEDIKTYPKEIENKDLKVPLQHVIYTLALNSIGINNVICNYDLPLCDIVQPVDKNYLNKGINKLCELFDEIKLSDFHPNPTPLCHWCLFSKTYQNQPEEAKGLCPYYSLWTRENKKFAVNQKWLGIKQHQKILENFQKNHQQ